MIHNDLQWLGTSIFSDSRGGSSGISQGNRVTLLTSTQIGSTHFSRSPEQQHWVFHRIPPLTSSHPTKALGYFQQAHPAASFSQRSLTFVICVGNVTLMPFFYHSSTIVLYGLDAMKANQTDKPGENNSHHFTLLSLWHAIMYVNLFMLWRNNKWFCKDIEVQQWSKQLVSEREPLPDLVGAFEWWRK